MAYGAHEVRQTYGDISISDAKNMTALAAACDQLLMSAVQTLVMAQAREYYTVDCYVPVPLMPGQTVKIENATRTVPNVATTSDWTILEVTERLVDGRPRTEAPDAQGVWTLRVDPGTHSVQLRRASDGAEGVRTVTALSLIHISEPTRPY